MAMTNNTQQSTSRAGWEEDRVRIQAMIAERAEGGSHDPRSEALSICRRWGKPTDWVEEGCDRAEEEWTKREIEEARKGAKKVLGALQPPTEKVEKPLLRREALKKSAEQVSEIVQEQQKKREEEKVSSFLDGTFDQPAKAFLDRTFDQSPKVWWPEAPLPPQGASELEKLTYPRGLLGHAVKYIDDTNELPHRWLALGTALSALAKGLDRRILGPNNNSTILWMLLMAETGAGKNHGLNCLRMLLRAMGIEDVLVAGGLGSMQGVEEILTGTSNDEPDGQPNALVAIDEIGAWLKRISSKGQTGNVSEIPGTLQILWGFSPLAEWIGTKTKGKKMKVVHGPAFAIYGASTEKKLIRALTVEQIGEGFVNRMLLINVGRGALERVKAKYEWTKFPAWLGKALKEVVGKAPPNEGPIRLTIERGGEEIVLNDFRRVGWGVGAEDLWRTYENSIRAFPSTEDRELWIRAADMALRLATIVAVYRGSTVVEVEDWQWAQAVVDQSMRWLAAALRKHLVQDLEQVEVVDRLREQFLKLLRKNKEPELTQGVIRKFCEGLVGKDHRRIDQAIDHLVKCGDIAELDQAGKVGQPTRKWRWQSSI